MSFSYQSFFFYSIWSETDKLSVKIINNRFSNFCLFLLPTGLFLAYMNYIRFGSVFETGYGSQATLFSFEFFRRDWFDYIFSMQRGPLWAFLHTKVLTYQATNLFTDLTFGQFMGSSSSDFNISVLLFHGPCSL